MKILRFPIISEEEKQRVLVLKQECEIREQAKMIKMIEKRRLLEEEEKTNA